MATLASPTLVASDMERATHQVQNHLDLIPIEATIQSTVEKQMATFLLKSGKTFANFITRTTGLLIFKEIVVEFFLQLPVLQQS